MARVAAVTAAIGTINIHDLRSIAQVPFESRETGAPATSAAFSTT
jgi:hypothetical protein